jgi:hypothetical protein
MGAVDAAGVVGAAVVAGAGGAEVVVLEGTGEDVDAQPKINIATSNIVSTRATFFIGSSSNTFTYI